MELVVLHYHLNRGGVTSVIENHLRSLATLPEHERPTRVTICYGGRRAAWKDDLAPELPFECSLAEIPELEYDSFRYSKVGLYDAVAELIQHFQRDTTLVHIHNHCLGKNAEIAAVVGSLAEQGWRLLLQIHDFAEDLRPANYQYLVQSAVSMDALHEQLYPQAAQIHYAVLNHRDRRILQCAGIADERLHLLPNPVQQQDEPHDADQIASFKSEIAERLALPPGQRLVLYPVRPIRRKNLGELLLWSLLAENTTFALTLAPLNPKERVSYQRWVDFANSLKLPVLFEIADRVELPFESVYAAADAIITTSVAEGFGMVYLEASLAGRQLVGRKLPEVCSDFEAAGMGFPGLCDSFQIPAEAVDLQRARQSHRKWITRLRQEYGISNVADEEPSDLDTLFSGDTVDFARLESDQQRDFLRGVKTESTLRENLRQLNTQVQALGADVHLQQTIELNCRVIAEHYSPQTIGRKLKMVYGQLLACQPTSVEGNRRIAQSVLHRFVHPALLYPIRLES